MVEIEYLESTGTQYIKTPIIPINSYVWISFRFRWVGNTTNKFETVFGFIKQSNLNRITFNKYQGKWMFGFNATISMNSVDSDIHDVLISRYGEGNSQSAYVTKSVVLAYLGCQCGSRSRNNIHLVLLAADVLMGGKICIGIYCTIILYKTCGV